MNFNQLFLLRKGPDLLLSLGPQILVGVYYTFQRLLPRKLHVLGARFTALCLIMTSIPCRVDNVFSINAPFKFSL